MSLIQPTIIEVFITHIESDGPLLKLWGQVDRAHATFVERAIIQLTENFERGVGIPSRIEAGHLCCARYSDGKYYRGRITSTGDLPPGVVGVHFVDYGNSEVVGVGDIRSLEDPALAKLASVPEQATDFFLAGVLPLQGNWDEVSLKFIKQTLCYEELKCMLVSQMDNKRLISVYYGNEDFTQLLIQKKVGVGISLHNQQELLNGYYCLKAGVPPQFQSLSVPPPRLLVPPPQQQLAGHSMSLLTPIRMASTPQRFVQQPVRETVIKAFTSPKLDVNSEHMVYVSFVEDGPLSFAVQLQNREETLSAMMNEMNNLQPEPLTQPLMPGSVCLGRYSEDQSLCRAVVMALLDDKCRLYYVDFGNSEILSHSDIFDLPDRFVNPEVMALRFTLSGVKNLTVTDELKSYFKELVTEKLLRLRVVEPEGPPIKQYGELYLNNKNVFHMLFQKVKEFQAVPPNYADLDLNVGSSCPAKVSFVVNVSNFYVQLEKSLSALNSVMLAIEAICNNIGTVLDANQVRVGLPCCALFSEDETWYRAKILSVTGEMAEVLYVDYGNTSLVPLSHLKNIDRSLITMLSAQAVPCCLSGFENNVDDNLAVKFEEITLEKSLFMKVVGKLQDRYLVELQDKSTGTSIDISAQLLTQESSAETSCFLQNGSQQATQSQMLAHPPEIDEWKESEAEPTPADASYGGRSFEKKQWSGDRDRSDQRGGRHQASYREAFPNLKGLSWRFSQEKPRRPNEDSGDWRSRRDDRDGNKPWQKKESWRQDDGDKPRGRFGGRDGGDGNGKWNSRDDDRHDSTGRDDCGDFKKRSFGRDEDGGGRGGGRWNSEEDGRRKKWNDNEDGGFRKKWNNDGDGGGFKKKWNNDDDGGGFKKKWNDGDDGGGFKKKWNDGDDSSGFKKKWNNDDDGGGFKKKWNDGDDGGGFKKKWNDGDDSGGFKKKWNNDDDGGGFKKKWNDGDGGGFKKKWNNNEDDGGGFKKKWNDDDGGRKWNNRGDNDSSGRGFRSQRSSQYEDRKTDTWGGSGSETVTESTDDWDTPAVGGAAVSAPKFPEACVNVGDIKTVTIVFITSPEEFCVQNISESNKLTDVMDGIAATYGSGGGNPIPVSDLKTGTPCVARYSEDETYYRAIIESVDSETAKVLFCDYGNKEDVPLGDVKEVSTEYLQLPTQGIVCKLSGAKPNQSTWSDDEVNEFTTLTDGKELKAQFVKKSIGFYEIILEDTETGIKLNEKFGASASDLTNAVSSASKPCATFSKGSVDSYPLAAPDKRFCIQSLAPETTSDVIVTWFINPEQFYCQLVSSKNELNDMMNLIQSAYCGKSTLTSSVQVGSPVIAKFLQDSVLYRAEIKDIPDPSSFIVQFIDYGNCDLMTKKNMWDIQERFVNLPKQAILCSLKGVKPIQSEWTRGEGGVDKFFECENFQCTFHNCENGVYLVSLKSGNKNIADELVKNGFAVEIKSEEVCDDQDAEPLDLNILPGQILSSYVTYIEGISKFYVQLRKELADKIQALIEEHVQNPENMKPFETAEVNSMCIASPDGEQWYRGRILDCATTTGVFVKFIDFGDGDEIPLDKVVGIPPMLMQFPDQALECCVSCSEGVDIPPEVEDKFKEDFEANNIVLSVDAVSDGRLLVTLFTSEGKKLAHLKDIETPVNEIEPIYPLPILVKKMVMWVSNAEGTSVWLQRVCDVDVVSELLEKLFSFYEMEGTAKQMEPSVGKLCAAKSANDEQWYRGRITSMNPDESTCTVLFIDYGNSETLPFSQVKELDPSLFMPFTLAVPAILPIKFDENVDITSKLLEMTGEKEFVVQFSHQKDHRWIVDLFENNSSLCKKLISVGIATELEDYPFFEPEVPAAAVAAGGVYISYVEKSCEVWIQVGKNYDAILSLQDDLQAVADSVETITLIPTVGTMCLALFSGAWYRAVVLDTTETSVTVRFIDYGNTEKVDIGAGEMKSLPDRLKDTTAYAEKYYLGNPGEWSFMPEASERIEILTEGSDIPCTMNVLHEGEIKSIELYLPDGSNILDILSSEGLAKRLCASQSDGATGTTSNVMEAEVVFISHVNSPCSFWVQFEIKTNEIEEMENRMLEAENFSTLDSADEGTLCAGKFSDGVWYRAKIEKHINEGYEVLFIDYGNTALCTELKSLPEDLLSMPPLAKHCSLAVPDNLIWSETAKEKFLERAAEGTVPFSITIVEESVPALVKLYEEGQSVEEQLLQLCVDTSITVAQELVGTDETPVVSGESPVVSGESPVVFDEPAVTDSASLSLHLLPKACVCHVDSLSDFWIQYEDDDPVLSNIADQLAGADNFPVLDEPVKDSLCVAFFPDDGKWYRAKILECNENEVKIIYIDFGNTLVTTEVRELPSSLLHIPPVVKNCSLCLPSTVTEWPDYAYDKFIEITKDLSKLFEISIIEDGTPAVISMCDGSEKLEDILLRKDEMAADKKEEEDIVHEKEEFISGRPEPTGASKEDIHSVDNENETEKFTDVESKDDDELAFENALEELESESDLERGAKEILDLPIRKETVTEYEIEQEAEEKTDLDDIYVSDEDEFREDEAVKVTDAIEQTENIPETVQKKEEQPADFVKDNINKIEVVEENIVQIENIVEATQKKNEEQFVDSCEVNEYEEKKETENGQKEIEHGLEVETDNSAIKHQSISEEANCNQSIKKDGEEIELNTQVMEHTEKLVRELNVEMKTPVSPVKMPSSPRLSFSEKIVPGSISRGLSEEELHCASVERPASPAKRPASPAVRPASPAKRPASPAVRPASPAKRPASPAKRPASPAVRPASPAERPASPTVRPASPAVRPASPAKRPASPAVRPASPAERPASPTVRPASPAQRPASPTVRPASPAERCASPTERPASPAKRPDSPAESPASPKFPHAEKIVPGIISRGVYNKADACRVTQSAPSTPLLSRSSKVSKSTSAHQLLESSSCPHSPKLSHNERIVPGCISRGESLENIERVPKLPHSEKIIPGSVLGI